MWGILAAVISGVLMSVQGVFNTGLAKETGIWISAAFVQLTAFIVCMAAWFFTGTDSGFGELLAVDNKYRLLGGVIGAFITITVIKSVDQLGPAAGITTIVIAQTTVAYLIEVFGLFGTEKVPFTWRGVIGVALAVAGVFLLNRK
ncbi:MAG: DMT family transporter [Ruminococcaceae bacterium]|nr:DMT family transporter [Oscillospiraceae bacterium]